MYWGLFSAHNSHIWARDSPHTILENGYQGLFTVGIWVESSGTLSCIPFCYLTGRILNDVLTLWELFCRGFCEAETLWLQHHGAPAHCGEYVQQWLNTCPRRWNGYRGPTDWPSRSLGLTPTDFFLCGHLKCTFMQSFPGLSKISWKDFKQLCQRWMPTC
jgi:hypothetical protein